MSSPPQSPPPYQRPIFHVARHAAKAEQLALDRDDLEPPVPPEIHRPARTLRLVIGAVLVIAVGVVAALGGFERDPNADAGPPIVKVDQQFAAGIWDITINGATAGTERRGQKVDGGFVIEMDVTVANTGLRTRSVFDVFKLIGVDGLKDKTPTIINLRDNRLNSYVQPGLPEKVALIWKVGGGTTAPKELKIEVHGAHPRPVSLGIHHYTYDYTLDVDAIATVPVTS